MLTVQCKKNLKPPCLVLLDSSARSADRNIRPISSVDYLADSNSLRLRGQGIFEWFAVSRDAESLCLTKSKSITYLMNSEHSTFGVIGYPFSSSAFNAEKAARRDATPLNICERLVHCECFRWGIT